MAVAGMSGVINTIIGGLIAILSAAVVLHMQTRSQRKVLELSLRTEIIYLSALTLLYKKAHGSMKDKIGDQEMSDGLLLQRLSESIAHNMPVYENNVDKIGMIDSRAAAKVIQFYFTCRNLSSLYKDGRANKDADDSMDLLMRDADEAINALTPQPRWATTRMRKKLGRWWPIGIPRKAASQAQQRTRGGEPK